MRWGKNTYTEEKWADPQEGDKKRLQDFYLNQGYVTASVGEPTHHLRGRQVGLLQEEAGEVGEAGDPGHRGRAYRVGEIKFEGMTVFKEEGIRPLFKLQPGDVYKESRIKKG